jgi:hypothetical protein
VQIIPPGGQLIPPRKKFHEVVGTETNPLVKPLTPRRVKIVADTAIRGTLAYKNSVYEFDISTFDGREDFSLLIGCMKAVKVDISTPLVTMAAPVTPPPLPVEKKEQAPTLAQLATMLATALREAGSPKAKA